jgi:hypothetical protein
MRAFILCALTTLVSISDYTASAGQLEDAKNGNTKAQNMLGVAYAYGRRKCLHAVRKGVVGRHVDRAIKNSAASRTRRKISSVDVPSYLGAVGGHCSALDIFIRPLPNLNRGAEGAATAVAFCLA